VITGKPSWQGQADVAILVAQISMPEPAPGAEAAQKYYCAHATCRPTLYPGNRVEHDMDRTPRFWWIGGLVVVVGIILWLAWQYIPWLSGSSLKNYRLAASTVSALILGGVLSWCAAQAEPEERVMHIAVMVLGASLGWIISILASPYGETEQKQFSQIVKDVSVFLSGYALAKIDPIIARILSPDALLSNQTNIVRTLLFLSAFLLSLLLTFEHRQYGRLTQALSDLAL
jgi:hypothetical protein